MPNLRLGYLIAVLVFVLDQLTKWIVTGPLGVDQLGDQLGIPADLRHDCRQAAAHGLEQCDRQSFGRGSEDGNIHRRVTRVDIATISRAVHVWRDATRLQLRLETGSICSLPNQEKAGVRDGRDNRAHRVQKPTPTFHRSRKVGDHADHDVLAFEAKEPTRLLTRHGSGAA